MTHPRTTPLHSPDAQARSAPRRASFVERFAGLPEPRLDRVLPCVIALLAALVYFHTIDGGWVYDDVMWIEVNPLIRDPALFKKALLSDVWAFLPNDESAGSRYWRPTLVAWAIAHYQGFGAASSTPWRLSLILTHAIASALAYLVARRIGLRPLFAAGVALVFALHPSRAESVAWVSGAADPLLGLFLLGSLLCVLVLAPASEASSDGRSRAHRRRVPIWVAALVLYALALGTKEVAILFPLVVFVAASGWGDRATDARLSLLPTAAQFRRGLRFAAPFLPIAIAYLAARAAVLTRPTITVAELPFSVNLLTLPSVGLFYLRQAIAPFRIAPFYSLAHVTEGSLESFFLPALLFAGAGALLLFGALGPWRSRATVAGLALFVVLIAPAAYATHFPPDQIVHDRYLYIPLLGLCLLAAGLVQRALSGRSQARVDAAFLSIVVIIAAIYGLQTFRYAEAWKTAPTMWAWSVKHEPDSGLALHHYGMELSAAGRHGEAVPAFERAIRAQPQINTYLALAEAQIELAGKAPTEERSRELFADAERNTRLVLDHLEKVGEFPHFYPYGLDLLARIRLERDDDVDRAIEVYRRALPNLPSNKAYAYDRMAMILIRDGMSDPSKDARFDQALALLEEARAAAAREATNDSRMIRFRLGQMYARRSRLDEAASEFEWFIANTRGLDHPWILDARAVAQTSIQEIRKLKTSPASGAAPGAGSTPTQIPAPAPATPGPP